MAKHGGMNLAKHVKREVAPLLDPTRNPHAVTDIPHETSPPASGRHSGDGMTGAKGYGGDHQSAHPKHT